MLLPSFKFTMKCLLDYSQNILHDAQNRKRGISIHLIVWKKFWLHALRQIRLKYSVSDSPLP